MPPHESEIGHNVVFFFCKRYTSPSKNKKNTPVKKDFSSSVQRPTRSIHLPVTTGKCDTRLESENDRSVYKSNTFWLCKKMSEQPNWHFPVAVPQTTINRPLLKRKVKPKRRNLLGILRKNISFWQSRTRRCHYIQPSIGLIVVNISSTDINSIKWWQELE